MRHDTVSRAEASIDKAVLNLAQFAFDLLSAGVRVEQPQRQFFSERPTGPLEPFRSFPTIAKYLHGESVDAVNPGKTIGSRWAQARRKDVFALHGPLRNTEDVKQKRPIHRQKPRDLVEPSCRKALSDRANRLTCGRRDAHIPVRHLSIIIRQMSPRHKICRHQSGL